MFKDKVDPLFSGCSQTVEVGPSEHAGLRAQGDGLDHIGASPYSTIEDDVRATSQGVGY
tara:strand:+ start:632 stop:808 length:177 start_codon:yes stop_codon:yes gene_type:complete